MERRRVHIDPQQLRERLARGSSTGRDPETSRRILAERARRLAEAADTTRQVPTAAVAFDTNGERYAIPTGGLSRIERSGTLVRLPGSPPFLLGVVPVRNRSWPILHLPALLGSPRIPPGPPRWALLLGSAEVRIAFGADTVSLIEVILDALHPVRDPARVRLGALDDARVVLDGAALAAYAARRLRGAAP